MAVLLAGPLTWGTHPHIVGPLILPCRLKKAKISLISNHSSILVSIFLKSIFLGEGQCRTKISDILFSNEMYFLNIVYSKYVYGEGNGTPLQYSCLENPMNGGAW